MAITVYEYGPIDINAGCKLECKIESETDIELLQVLFVDLCCRCLDINDILLGYDEENNPVDAKIKYPINERFAMIFDNLHKRLMVLSSNNNADQSQITSLEGR